MTGVKPGVYQRIKENVDRDDLKVFLAFCVTRLNHECIEDMLKEWSRTSVKGIVFEFYTPMKGEDNNLWLNWHERDKVIGRLKDLRKDYGSFMWIEDHLYRLMKSDVSSKITQNCPFHKVGYAFDSMGNAKMPCQLGPGVDCSRCGCILPFFSVLLTHRRRLIYEFALGVSRISLKALTERLRTV
jgi:hypothetical protein